MRTLKEQQAVARILDDAKIYGYGNLIHCLKNEWVKELIESGLDRKTAIKSADVSKGDWNGVCRCGHLHTSHNEKQRNANISAGKCKECDCPYFVHDVRKKKLT